MKLKIILFVIELIFQATGILIIGFLVNWWAVLGLFFWMWGNNMMTNRKLVAVAKQASKAVRGIISL